MRGWGGVRGVGKSVFARVMNLPSSASNTSEAGVLSVKRFPEVAQGPNKVGARAPVFPLF